VSAHPNRTRTPNPARTTIPISPHTQLSAPLDPARNGSHPQAQIIKYPDLSRAYHLCHVSSFMIAVHRERIAHTMHRDHES